MPHAMVTQPSPRRIALVTLFVVWLACQPLAVGLSPAWSAVLPHEHLTRGVVTAAQWQAHLREHLGLARVAATDLCLEAKHSVGNSVLGSVPDSSGLVTDFGLAGNLHDAFVRIPAIAPLAARVVESAPAALALYYPPPTQPPNA